MRRVRREEIVDHVTYAETRDAFRQEVLEVKRPRRVHLGADLTLLFENTLTVRYQVQEMMRTEQTGTRSTRTTSSWAVPASSGPRS
jgi:hypothetical protein